LSKKRDVGFLLIDSEKWWHIEMVIVLKMMKYIWV